MLNKTYLLCLLGWLFGLFFVFGDVVQAQTYLRNIANEAFNAQKSVNPETFIYQRVGNVIKIFLSFVGTILLVVIIYSGFLWLTAGGNQEQVTKARKLITNGVIGMIIITAAYFLTDFIIGALE